ncbi:hypothetical protein HPDFL43_00825 [Hoeflea phototrophica DFL-43]|uniref:Uncharacterized protein n=1 Tax=Hoeflea phototrophica (strain DSM 17068 / NCIMB 14078 / DFL-43) TaxID=411684 RepID=A9CZ39_HOEPD|nr:hypothetical protein [Hoeflea phototrophica]EDQ34696.2 hypothetical protein HPDFL43_00825 [Hoeflea phototrophica DFL-43]
MGSSSERLKLFAQFPNNHFTSIFENRFSKGRETVVAQSEAAPAKPENVISKVENRSARLHPRQKTAKGSFSSDDSKRVGLNATLARNIRSALNRDVVDQLAALDLRAADCRENSGTNLMASINCIQTLGGNINSRMLQMRVDKVFLDKCNIIDNGQFLCRYRGTIQAGDSADPLMKLLQMASKVGGFKYGVFDSDDFGWYLVEYYDSCKYISNDGVYRCRREVR